MVIGHNGLSVLHPGEKSVHVSSKIQGAIIGMKGLTLVTSRRSGEASAQADQVADSLTNIAFTLKSTKHCQMQNSEHIHILQKS